MSQVKRIPDNKEIIWLSKLITSYPITRRQVVRMARMWNFRNEVIVFLRQFDPDEQFMSRTDLVARCEDMAKAIRHEWEARDTKKQYR